MASRLCDACGTEAYLPYVCKFCKGRYCSLHRLPENHACAGLSEYREKMRAEGRIISPTVDVMTPSMDASARAGAFLDRVFERAHGKMAYVMLATMVGVFFLQSFLIALGKAPLMSAVFVLSADFYLRPWALVTSVFAHGGFQHLFANGIVLFFFGPTLESLIGTRRFTYLFLGSGVLAGAAHVLIFQYVLPATITGFPPALGVIGASGAIMGLLGTLTVLAPRITVLLFFVIPVQLWIITIGYAFIDFVFLFDRDGVAHLAHLAGLATGLLFGRHLHAQGLRARIQPPSAGQFRRPF